MTRSILVVYNYLVYRLVFFNIIVDITLLYILCITPLYLETDEYMVYVFSNGNVCLHTSEKHEYRYQCIRGLLFRLWVK